MVLVEPQGPINVGMVARTLKNMGFRELVLVNPKCPPLHPYALVMAPGAKDLLSEAKVLGDLREAIRDSALVVGTTRRRRKGRELIPLRAASQEILRVAQGGQKVSILFGREDTGLTNRELSLCHLLVTIPTDPIHGSLNLSQAVAVVLYELRTSAQGEEMPGAKGLAPWGELEGLFEHLQEVLLKIGFLDPNDPRAGHEDLKGILMRARLDSREVRLLRGVLRQITWAIERVSKGEEL